MKTFPTIVTAIFVLLALAGVLIFATYTSINKSTIGTVSVWGSLPHSVFDSMIGALSKGNSNYSNVTYQVIPEDRIVPQLVEAIASGKGPDLVIFPESDLVGQADKLQTIPYSSYSKRTFQDNFIQAGESFLTQDGVLGLPFTIDPIVMYWNRSLFATAGIATPPRYWDEISTIAPKLTKADKNSTLTVSAVSFGTWSNVDHAKEIFLTLLNQLGNPVIALNDKGEYTSVLLGGKGGPTLPADSALRFYTGFADPTQPLYSWNSSEPHSRDAFIAGNLAIYFGYSSELTSIRGANPNLNFDVAAVPAIRGGGQGVYGNMDGLSVPNGAKNPAGAFLLAEDLTAVNSQTFLQTLIHLPSVRRDVSTTDPSDPYATIFRSAALTAFTFLDPNPSATNSIFKRMTESVSSGKLQVSEATGGAHQELQALLGVQ